MMRSCDPYTGAEPLPQLSYEKFPGAANQPLGPGGYRPAGRPEYSPLYRAVYHGLAPLLEQADAAGTAYPAFIEKELRKLLGCRIIGRGFARVVCPKCKAEHLLAFTCKSRACPSCWSRRAADFAATTVDHALPEVPYRQFVITFAWAMRFALAFEPTFLTQVFRGFVRAVFSWYRLRARRRGIRGGAPGAILMIQRHGSAINLNPHGHLVVTDGLFVTTDKGQPLGFEPLPTPTDDELQALFERVKTRTIALYKKHHDDEDLVDPDEQLLAQTMVQALRAPISSHSAATAQKDQEQAQTLGALCLQQDGFSLHAKRKIESTDREGLERLLRYGARAPIAASRLSIDHHGQVVYKLTKPWGVTGATALRLEPAEFIRRLAMLIPPPYQPSVEKVQPAAGFQQNQRARDASAVHLIRHFGAFASRSKLRPLLPAPPSANQGTQAPIASQDAPDEDTQDADQEPHTSPPSQQPPRRPYRLPWAQLMKRVMGVDALKCSCGAQMVVLAFISKIDVVRKILDHLKIPANASPPPLSHGPCTGQTELEGLEPSCANGPTVQGSLSSPHQDSGHSSPRGPPPG